MKNTIKYLYIFIFLFSITFSFSSLVAEELMYEIISEGYYDSTNRSQSQVVLDKDVLKEILKEQSVDKEINDIDFETETVALIVPDKSSYPDSVIIEDIIKNNQGIISVNYNVLSLPYVPQKDERINRPYKLIKIFPAGKEFKSVSFRKMDSASPVFVNNSVDNIIKYSNVMEDNRENLFLNYLPLDKGNSWTYDFESPRGKGSQTFSIVTYTNGWSIFDSYFGMNNLALRLDRGGHIHVSSDTGNRPFYTPDVLVSYPKETFKSGTSEFNDILVVTSSDKSNVKFKDIYARDVGLVYHEHQTKNGLAKYSLSNAYVRGKQIP